MTDFRSGPLSATAAAATGKPKTMFWRICRLCARTTAWVPAFLFILGLYAIIKMNVADIRAPFVSFGSYAIAWVEVLYILAFGAAILELLKVSNPGNNDTIPALLMTIVGIAYIVLFTLGAAGLPTLAVFATSEFLVLIFVSAIQVGMAFWINSATLQRTIGHNGGE